MTIFGKKKKEPEVVKNNVIETKDHCWHPVQVEKLGNTHLTQEKCCHCEIPKFTLVAPEGHGPGTPRSEWVIRRETDGGCMGHYYRKYYARRWVGGNEYEYHGLANAL